MTVTTEQQAKAESKEIEKKQKREEKDASFGGAVRDSVPEDRKVERWVEEMMMFITITARD